MRRTAVLVALTALALPLAGCGSSSASPSSPSAQASSSVAVSGTVTVFAAASLREAFTALGKTFEAAHPGTTVTFSFGPSSGLAQQITQGAPADVFASASPKNMDQVVRSGEASGPSTFARNTLEIAVPPANPAHITGVADLARAGVKVALCQPQVPCGTVAANVLSNAKLTVTPATLEVDVKSVLSKVMLGEVDAGLVYVTDVRAAGAKVQGIPIPDDVNAGTTYPVAALSKAPNATGAKAFVDLVLSAEGRTALATAGFASP